MFLLSCQIALTQKIMREEYILRYKDIAIAEMLRTGVPASITLAQGILESESGNSRLAQQANNHFGIKCHNGWTGAKIYHDDDSKGECFRVYKTPEESYSDHSDFLAQRKRYAFLFDLPTTDYKGWSKGLKSSGYATNRHYDKMLIKIIETHQLYLYDQKVDIKKSVPIAQTPKKQDRLTKERRQPQKHKTTNAKNNVSETTEIDFYGQNGGQINRIDFIFAQSGDTWQSLTKKHNKMAWELYKYNDISREMPAEIVEGQVIFLQPKRRKAEHGNDYHIVTSDETMWSISQKYGIRLARLYKLNRMTPDQEPATGQKLYLRKRKPKNN